MDVLNSQICPLAQYYVHDLELNGIDKGVSFMMKLLLPLQVELSDEQNVFMVVALILRNQLLISLLIPLMRFYDYQVHRIQS